MEKWEKDLEEWEEEQEYYNDTPTRVLNEKYEEMEVRGYFEVE